MDSQAATIIEFSSGFDEAGIEYWLIGGWAVDCHVGHVTRPHGDIDFVIWVADHERVIALMIRAGFVPKRPPLAYERDGVEVELTPINRLDDGVIVTPGYEEWPWYEGSFDDDVGSLHGQPVRIASVDGLLAVKVGWEQHFDEPPRPHDIADIDLLRHLQSGN